MGFESISNLESVVVPDFQSSIPSNWNNIRFELLSLVRRFDNRRVSNARNPISVIVLLWSKLAISQSVPQLDFFTGASRDNLSVVRRESHWKNFFVIACKYPLAFAWANVPESERLIPRRWNYELVFLRNSQISDEVIVSSERFIGNSVEISVHFFE